MSVVNLSSSRILPDTEIEHVAQLAVTFSRRLARATLGDIIPAIAEALEQVAAATRVDACRLVEFTDSGSVARVHAPTRTANGADRQHSWPGNVRELENVIERAMIASTGETLQFDAALPFSRRSTAHADAPDNLDSVQRAHIEAVLQRCGWRINGSGNAAERLGIHPNTLRFRMKKLGVSSPGSRGRDLRPPAPGPSA